jgi:hypothetical protein
MELIPTVELMQSISGMSSEDLISAVIPFLATVATAAASFLCAGAAVLLNRGATYLKQKSDQIRDEAARKMVRDAIDRLDDVAGKVVAKIEQTTAGALRQAVKDQKVDRIELLNLGNQAYEEVMTTISPEVEKVLRESLGDLQNYIVSTIESKVLEIKGGSKTIISAA